MALDTIGLGTSATFLASNYMFDDGAPISWSPYEVGFPPINILDPRPNRLFKFATGELNEKSIVMRVFGPLSASSLFNPQAFVFANMNNWQNAGPGGDFNQEPYFISLHYSNNAVDWISMISNQQVVPTYGNSLFINGAAIGLPTPNAQYWRITFKAVSGNLRQFSIGAFMMGEVYTPPRGSVLVGLSVSLQNTNIATGRSTGAIFIHKSNSATRVYRGRFVCESATDAADILNHLRGYNGTWEAPWFNYQKRLNWVQAFVPPDGWYTGTFSSIGVPVIGYFTRSSMDYVANNKYFVNFEFTELTAGVQ